MRVVAGLAGGRRLQAPAGRKVRPTSERVREALFNALGSMDAIAGATVLDLFAGTGALGIEALSRGATTATFVDADPRAIAAIKANLQATGHGRAGAGRAGRRRALPDREAAGGRGHRLRRPARMRSTAGPGSWRCCRPGWWPSRPGPTSTCLRAGIPSVPSATAIRW